MTGRQAATPPAAAAGEAARQVEFHPPDGPLELRRAPAPEPGEGEALVRTLATGIDGTDEEVVAGRYGAPPPGEDALIPGHECLGAVVEAPRDSRLRPGDPVVPLVRVGCGMCATCRYDAADMCPHDDYRERGIKGLHGFMRDYWTAAPDTLVKAPPALGDLAVLTEPLSIVVKALDQAQHFQRRLPWFMDEGGFRGRRALVAGTGSLGSLAAFLLRHEGMRVWAMDRSPHDAAAATILGRVGVEHVNARERDVRHVADDVGGFDLVIEATGAPEVVFDVLETLDANGVCGLLGVPPEKAPFPVEGDALQRRMVQDNQVLFGSVNSNRSHYWRACEYLGAFRDRWGADFEDVITHTYAPDDYAAAFRDDGPDVVKKVMRWA